MFTCTRHVDSFTATDVFHTLGVVCVTAAARPRAQQLTDSPRHAPPRKAGAS